MSISSELTPARPAPLPVALSHSTAAAEWLAMMKPRLWPTRPPMWSSPATLPDDHAAATRPRDTPASAPALPAASRTSASGSPSATTSALDDRPANSPELSRARFTNRLSTTWPLPSNVALKCVVAPTAVAAPMGSQPVPPLFQASLASPATVPPVSVQVPPLPSVSKSRSFSNS